MSYDPNKVTPSFREALAGVLKGKKVEEEIVEHEEVVEEEVIEEENLELLGEEELLELMEKELGPHIAYLLDEGFSEEEVENIIVEMLEDDETE